MLCNKQAKSRYMGMELAPTAAGVQQVTLETKTGELIGLLVDYDPPVVVDFRALTKRLGARRRLPRSPHSRHPGEDGFDLSSPSHAGSFAIGRVDEADPLDKTRVRSVGLRRTSKHELLPETTTIRIAGDGGAARGVVLLELERGALRRMVVDRGG